MMLRARKAYGYFQWSYWYWNAVLSAWLKKPLTDRLDGLLVQTMP
jgi:hypothetical protein